MYRGWGVALSSVAGGELVVTLVDTGTTVAREHTMARDRHCTLYIGSTMDGQVITAAINWPMSLFRDSRVELVEEIEIKLPPMASKFVTEYWEQTASSGRVE